MRASPPFTWHWQDAGVAPPRNRCNDAATHPNKWRTRGPCRRSDCATAVTSGVGKCRPLAVATVHGSGAGHAVQVGGRRGGGRFLRSQHTTADEQRGPRGCAAAARVRHRAWRADANAPFRRRLARRDSERGTSALTLPSSGTPHVRPPGVHRTDALQCRVRTIACAQRALWPIQRQQPRLRCLQRHDARLNPLPSLPPARGRARTPAWLDLLRNSGIGEWWSSLRST